MKSKQRGITIIESVAALAIGSMMLVGLSSMIDASVEDLKGAQAAHYQTQVVDAARAYIKANYADLKTAAYQTNIIVPVALNTLKTANYLPASFAAKNAYDQETCVLVRQPVAGSGKLEALIVTNGGNEIGDKDVAYVASQAGEGNGYITSALFTTAKGASWSIATDAYRNVACYSGGPTVLTGTAADGGHLVSNLFYDGPGQLSTDFLYRDDVPGRPELNQMRTPIRFVDDAIVAENAACGTQSAIAFGPGSELFKCGTDGKWAAASHIRAPVRDFAALGNIQNKKFGDVRMIENDVYGVMRAFVYDGSTWVPLAADQNGSLSVPRDVNAGRDVNAQRDLYAAADVTAGNQVNGNTIHSDWWVEATHFEPTQRRWPRDPCMVPSAGGYRWTLGSIVRDVNGVIMSCQRIGGEYVFAYTDGSFYP